MNVRVQERPKTVIERTIVLQMSEGEWAEICNALYAAKDYYQGKDLKALANRTLEIIDGIDEVINN